MDQKLRSYIDSMRASRFDLFTGDQVATALEKLFAKPVAAAFTSEQLQVVENVAVSVGNQILAQAAKQTDEKIAAVLKQHMPNAVQ